MNTPHARNPTSPTAIHGPPSAATPREILVAARHLFAEQGCSATSIQQIAAASGVAVQTIYSSVGSKPALVLALNDHIDEEVDVAAATAAVVAETRSGRLLAAAVRLTRQLNERCGAAAVAGRLAQPGASTDGTTPERAAEVLGLLTAPASWRQLTSGSGWSFDDNEAWINDSLASLLLKRVPRRSR